MKKGINVCLPLWLGNFIVNLNPNYHNAFVLLNKHSVKGPGYYALSVKMDSLLLIILIQLSLGFGKLQQIPLC